MKLVVETVSHNIEIPLPHSLPQLVTLRVVSDDKSNSGKPFVVVLAKEGNRPHILVVPSVIADVAQ